MNTVMKKEINKLAISITVNIVVSSVRIKMQMCKKDN
jgi:hypothetical protein